VAEAEIDQMSQSVWESAALNSDDED